ncbi:MAG: DUF3084 domain-containing protein [Candidatus Eremiobacteraeota bacterium]|nr:DUF3084 domain-containing protein [Candidatus Eremiobacteraeota bacterium]
MVRGILIIALVMCVGGIFAYLGSEFGRRVARRKISFLGLRPRYTSLLIIVLVGMFVTLFTITVISFYSQRARMALFGIRELESQRALLLAEIEELNKGRGSAALFRMNEPFALTVVPRGEGDSARERLVAGLIEAASREVERRNSQQALFLKANLLPGGKRKDLVTLSLAERERLMEDLSRATENEVVLACAGNNAYYGDKVSLRFVRYPNRILFKKGEKLFVAHLEGKATEEKVFFDLLDFMRQVEYRAERRGMVRVPQSQPLVDIPMAQVLAAVKEIRGWGTWVEVSALARNDLAASGPLSFILKITPQ